MKLRNWQSKCINLAISKYDTNQKNFLVLATPGAGKTVMASSLAKQLYDLNKIDLVLCFSPSSIVAHDFSNALSEQFNTHFDGTIGAMGNSYTYQGLSTLDKKVWDLFDKYRVFVIFDEIHHCAGSNIQNANSWGESIITKIKNNSAFSIALTGTPWRSDSLPIVLADYCNESGKIQCDYIYGLQEAIRDKVCRVPQIIALDNDQITVRQGNETNHFTSFIDLLSQSSIPYSEVVTNLQIIEQLVYKADNKLNELRKFNKNVGGLIVASSINHAWQIHQILEEITGISALVVTSDEVDSKGLIRSFRNNQDKWLISVGMVSEGTNIPRLQVCCYLSNVKTEMYYRQVLGRILRITDAQNQQAFLFMPAEPKLVDYAYNVAKDIPNGLSKVKFEQMNLELTAEFDMLNLNDSDYVRQNTTDQFIDEVVIETNCADFKIDLLKNKKEECHYKGPTQSDKKIMNILGQYNHTELEIDGFDNLVLSEQSIFKLTNYNEQAF
ncbi:MAG: superfamily II DNA or RNA helicase [Colwellia sp.]|jgi:superfamily II DNA or RNA helicase